MHISTLKTKNPNFELKKNKKLTHLFEKKLIFIIIFLDYLNYPYFYYYQPNPHKKLMKNRY